MQETVQNQSNLPEIKARMAEMEELNAKTKREIEFWSPLIQAVFVFSSVSWAALINTPLLWGATAGFIFYLLLKQK